MLFVACYFSLACYSFIVLLLGRLTVSSCHTLTLTVCSAMWYVTIPSLLLLSPTFHYPDSLLEPREGYSAEPKGCKSLGTEVNCRLCMLIVIWEM